MTTEYDSPLDAPVPDLAEGAAADRNDARARILARLAAWVDAALKPEGVPEGLSAEVLAEVERDVDVEETAVPGERCDLHAVWSALTALVQEVKLQGRAFKDLSGKTAAIGALGEKVDALARASAEAPAKARCMLEEGLAACDRREREAVRAAQRDARREMLETLADVGDRLRRGLALAQEREATRPEPRGGWFARLRARVVPSAPVAADTDVDALREAYRLTLERIEETLGRHGVVTIAAQGAMFDPRCMQAVQTERTASVPEGTVVAVLRGGYLWEDEVLRTAQVAVARAPARGEEP